MWNKLRRLCVVITTILLIVSIYGCGSQQDNSDNSNKDNQVIQDETLGVAYADIVPVIDGTIDVCWEKTEKLYTKNHYHKALDESNAMSTGYVSIMWDEDNLYLLGVVEDVDITRYDRINFWLSESFVDTKETVYYSPKLSDGVYYLCIGPWADNFIYENGIDFENDVIGYECKTSRNREGYFVEVKVPRQSQVDYKEGHCIGFDVSIDTYFALETERAEIATAGGVVQAYCNWNGQGKYWEEASALAALKLVK